MRSLRVVIIQSLCLILFVAECWAEHLGADEALSLLNIGEVLPLEEIISSHPVLSESRLLDVELERDDDGGLIYEFEILKKGNLVIELEVDATTGQLLREEFEE